MSSSKHWLTKAAEFVGETAASVTNEVAKVYVDSTNAISEAFKAGAEAFEKNQQPAEHKAYTTVAPDTQRDRPSCSWQACNLEAALGYELCYKHLEHFTATNRDAWRTEKPSTTMCSRYGCDAAVIHGELYCEQHLFEMHAFERTADLVKAEFEAAQTRRLASLCAWKKCSSTRLAGKDYCAIHQREYEQLRSRRCGVKLRHTSIESAHSEAAEMLAKTGDTFNAYHCNFCNHYHIGHTRKHYREFR